MSNPAHTPLVKLLLPLFAGILFVLICGFALFLWKTQEQRQQQLLNEDLGEVSRQLTLIREQETSWLTALMIPIAIDADTQTALQARDVQALRARWQNMFEQIRARNHVTHFYFIDAERRCLLRLHQPRRAGDRIDRGTMLQAQATGKPSAGIELGPLGTLTLRVVQPIEVDGKRIGYIELGKEITDLLTSLHQSTHLELIALIRKQSLSREGWQEGMAMLNSPAEWERLPHHVLVYSSLPGLGAGFMELIGDLTTTTSATPPRIARALANRYWLATRIPLHDIRDTIVGDLVVLRNFTGERTAFRDYTRILEGTTLTFLLLSLSLVTFLVVRTDRLIARQQHTLKERESRLAATLNSIGEGVLTTDPGQRITSLNRAAEQITGWSAEQAQGALLRDVLHLAPDVSARLQTEESSSETLLLLARDGTTRHVLSNCAAILTEESDSPLGQVIVLHDVSHEHHILEQLERSREQYALSIGSLDGIWDWDLRDGTLFFSPRWKEQIGYRDDELPNTFETFSSHLHPEERDSILHQIERYLAGESTHLELEFRFRHKDGSYRWMLSRGQALRDPRGRPYRMAGSHTDITSRRHAEHMRAAFSAMIEHSDAFILIKDLDLRIVAANHSFAQAMGATSSAELIGMTDAEILARVEDQELVRKTLEDERRAQQLPSGASVSREISMPDESGRTQTFLVKKYPIRDLDDQLIGTGSIAVDITARKQAEDALRETNQALAQALEQVAELAVRAEAANQAKSIFLSTMSHEIRTPMNGVIGMIELLLNTALSDEQRAYARVVQTSGEALLKLINDILDLSRIEADKLELERIDFDLRRLFEELAMSIAASAHLKPIELVCDIDPALPRSVCGDPGRLRQILENLLGNAIKFTEHGEIVLEIRLLEAAREDIRIRFAVRDTGIGIPADQTEALFESFRQADSSMSRRFGGSGLGLAICKQLTDLMGGHIDVRSLPSGGTEFHGELPLRRSVTPQTAMDIPAGLQGQRLLIVDDLASVRALLVAQTSAWGMQAEAHEQADQALEAARTAQAQGQPFAIALLDMEMPGRDGLHLGRILQEEEALHGIRVVRMIRLGAHTHTAHAPGRPLRLLKPVAADELLAVLCQALEIPSPSATVPAPVQETSACRSGTSPGASSRAYLDPWAEALRTLQPPPRLLLADDNPINRKVALAILHHLGLQADSVNNGREAIEALSQRDYDLLLLDVEMPEMDGFEVIRHIRTPGSGVRQPQLIVIAMTAHALQGDRERCLEAGMNDYVAKPVNPRGLANLLTEWLVHRSVPSPDTREDTPAPGPESAWAPVFDPEMLCNQTMGQNALAQQIIDAFLADLPQRLAHLRDSCEKADPEEIGHHARALQGAAVMIGASRLAARAQWLATHHQDLGDAQLGEEWRALENDAEELNGQLQQRHGHICLE